MSSTTVQRIKVCESRRLDLAAVTACVLADHRALRVLLDEVERAASSAKRDVRRRQDGVGGLARLHEAVWDLYVAFDEHLFLEERDLSPVLAALRPSGEDYARRMVLEHEEQRRALLRLVEDSETDDVGVEQLAGEAIELVVRLRTDMLLEERSLAPLVSSVSVPRTSSGR
jgi:hypothetical protein